MDAAASGTARWYAVHTKARQERVAREHLGRQAYRTLLPTIRQARRRANRWHSVIEPLFPGYLFVELDPNRQDTAPIRSTRGVIGLVRFGNELRPLPHGLVELLSGDDEAPLDPSALFAPGDPVQFVDGPLAGLHGVFQARSGAERVAVLLELLGREQQVRVSPHLIAPAS